MLILRRPRALLLVSCLAMVVAAPGLGRLELDNSASAFFVRDGERLEVLAESRRLFGGGPTLRIAWFADGPWADEGLGWLARVTRAAKAVPGVAAVDGPGEWVEGWGTPGGPAGDGAGRRLRAEPLARAAGWTTARGDLVSLVVDLEPGLSRRQGQRTLAALEELAAAAPSGVEGVVVGLLPIERAFDRAYARLLLAVFPAIALICFVLLLVACRRLVDAALPVATVAAAELSLLGVMGWTGERLNLITSILLPIVFVLGLVTATHLQMRFRLHRERLAPARGGRRPLDAGGAVAAALRERAWAIFWAGATTAAAFGSFAFSRLPAVRALGLWTAAGVALVIVAVFSFQAPAMVLSAAARRTSRPAGRWTYDRWAGNLGVAVAGLARRRRRATLLALAVVAALAAAGLPRLELDTSLLSHFRPDHPLRTGFEAIASRGVAPVSAELLLQMKPATEGASAPSFRDPQRLERLAELTRELRAEGSVGGALGVGDLFNAAGRRLIEGGPRSDRMRWLVLGLLQTDPEASRRFDRMVTRDGRATRLTLLVPVAGYEKLLPALEDAAARARAAFPEARVDWTGEYPLVLAAQREMLATMASSLALTGLVVALVLALLLRSLLRWAAALAANLWPLLVAGGVMGWTGIPLDATTVMIAAVVLGIAVDDTLHTLGELRVGGGDVAASIGGVAPAQLLTTVSLAVVFAGCALVDYLPIVRFGLVTAAAMVAALVGDWLLLPALWSSAGEPVDRRGR